MVRSDVHDQTRRELATIADWRGRSVLEVGCGEGRLSRVLASLDCELVAVDPDAAILAEARKVLPMVDFQCASGESLPFHAGRFDQVIFTLSLHHQDPVRALAEAKRVIHPLGRILVLEPTSNSEIERLCRLFHDETEIQQEARRALEDLPSSRITERTFQTEWHFEDAEEMIGGLFAYFSREREASLAAAIMESLGARREDRPLVLRDELYLGCIQFD